MPAYSRNLLYKKAKKQWKKTQQNVKTMREEGLNPREIAKKLDVPLGMVLANWGDRYAK